MDDIRKMTPPRLSVRNVEALKDFWRYHIETGLKENIETLWLIGFCGSGDIPFWQTFEDAPSEDADRARVIEDTMKLQVQLLKEVTGQQAPLMRASLYNENSDFVAQGLLRPPEEPSLI